MITVNKQDPTLFHTGLAGRDAGISEHVRDMTTHTKHSLQQTNTARVSRPTRICPVTFPKSSWALFATHQANFVTVPHLASFCSLLAAPHALY